MAIETITVDYRNPNQARDLITLLDEYAHDPMGGGSALSAQVKATLVEELAKRPQAFSLLCYVNGEAAALANCLEGFSTFAARPLLNIHDLMVRTGYRGQGLSQILLSNIEDIARRRGCCKITLEVLSGNTPAQGAYEKFGFRHYQLTPDTGQALFWQKNL
ncbi:MAG: GNAT family N-acetyltransferase [Alcanivorax sp.]|uniref:GNAT family N-acetyltransferase n=1 Tax=unclassified Ketobacter TaxID=2639109 RepID=UPI000F260CFF|nr:MULTISPECIES: GNAT family N-acetyltransferase [unclassified Ketobacter]RLT90355.1 MAG: GNAT family N-acetyltransferase [Ketobacter sp. GenoA1]RLT99452.1 MAG: GNAT family N-acetyltransferase [Ketobacter sp.]TNC89359.1 MAG: GNAT family N-acetyltransferase [Alcanivorax sp.]